MARYIAGKHSLFASKRRGSVADSRGSVVSRQSAFRNGDLASNAYSLQVSALRAQREALQPSGSKGTATAAQLQESVARTRQLATSFWDLYQPLPEPRRADLLRSVFSALVLDHHGVAGFTPKPPLSELLNSADGAGDPECMAQAILDAA